MITRRARLVAAAAAASIALALSACGSGENDTDGESSDGGDVTIEFFQSKSESIDVVNEIIADFEAANPGIKVEQNNTPDALTVMQSRLAKGDVPDVIAMNAGNFADMVAANILKDLTGTEAEASVDDQFALDYLAMLGGTDSVLGLPWSTNAQVVLYNKDLLAEYGLEVPTTWDEFIAAADTVQSEGGSPFYFTWKDSWTAKMLFNSVGGNLQPADMLAQLQAGSITFSDAASGYPEATQKMLELKEYANEDPFGKGYDDGNAAFADGESVFYVQGIWAISEIQAVNPDINIGAFAMPLFDTAEESMILSGPDSFVAVAEGSEHPEEAQLFLDYLLSYDAQSKFSNDQFLFSVRSDVEATSEILAPLKSEYIDEGRIAYYPDGMFLGSSDLSALAQQFLQDEDADTFLANVDADWQTHGLK